MKPTEALRQISSICAALRSSHPERKFPIDGMLVGDLGEVLAAERFGLRIVAQSLPGWDAETSDGRKVEIKATASRSRPSFAFRDDAECPRPSPDFVVCLQLHGTGEFEVVFNGPGHVVWPHLGRLNKRNQQRGITAKKLSALMDQVPQTERLERNS